MENGDKYTLKHIFKSLTFSRSFSDANFPVIYKAKKTVL